MILDLSSDHFRVKDVLVSEDAATTWEKCGEGQELYELLVRRDSAFTMSHALFPALGGRTEKIET